MIRDASKIYAEVNNPNTVLIDSTIDNNKLTVGAGNKKIKQHISVNKSILFENNNGEVDNFNFNQANKLIGTDSNSNLALLSNVSKILVSTGTQTITNNNTYLNILNSGINLLDGNKYIIEYTLDGGTGTDTIYEMIIKNINNSETLIYRNVNDMVLTTDIITPTYITVDVVTTICDISSNGVNMYATYKSYKSNTINGFDINNIITMHIFNVYREI